MSNNTFDEQLAQLDQLVNDKHTFAEQVRILYDYAPALFLLQFFFASFIAVGMADPLGQKVVFWGWLVLVVALVIAFFSYIGYKSSNDSYNKPRFWYGILLLAGSSLSLLWSAVFVYMLAHLSAVEHRVLVVTLIAVVLGCGVVMLAVRPLLLIICSICLLSAPIIWLALCELTFFYLLAALLLLQGISSCYFGWLYARRAGTGLRLASENRHLQEALRLRDNQLKTIHKELQQLSATDTLTQVANRSYFENRFHSEWRRIIRENSQLALLLVELDYFSDYNQHFGHQAGDLCIARIALCIRDSLRRPADLVARLSGNVFVVLLPNTPAAGAVRVGEMIRESTLHQEIKNPSPSQAERLLTVSIGVAHTKPNEETPPSALMALAEHALLASKKHNHNTVTFKSLDEELQQS